MNQIPQPNKFKLSEAFKSIQLDITKLSKHLINTRFNFKKNTG